MSSEAPVDKWLNAKLAHYAAQRLVAIQTRINEAARVVKAKGAPPAQLEDDFQWLCDQLTQLTQERDALRTELHALKAYLGQRNEARENWPHKSFPASTGDSNEAS